MLREIFRMSGDLLSSGDSADLRLWAAMRILLRQKTAMRFYENEGGNDFQRYDRWNNLEARIGHHLEQAGAASILPDRERLDLQYNIIWLMRSSFGRTSYRFRTELEDSPSRSFLRAHVDEIEAMAKAVAHEIKTLRQAMENPTMEQRIQVLLKDVIEACGREKKCYGGGRFGNHPDGETAALWMYREFRAALAERGWPLPMKDISPGGNRLVAPGQAFTALATAGRGDDLASDPAFEAYLAYHIKVAALDSDLDRDACEFMERMLGGEPVQYTQAAGEGPVGFTIAYGCKPVEDFVSREDLVRLRPLEKKLVEDIYESVRMGLCDKTWGNDSPEGVARHARDRKIYDA